MLQSLSIAHAVMHAKEHLVEVVLITVVLYLIYRFLFQKSKGKLPPGPMGLPFVGYLPFLGEKPYKTLAEMSKKYGDIIGLKLGPYYTIVIHEYNTMKEVFSNPASQDKPELLFESLSLGFGSANGAEWQEQRKFSLHLMRNLGLGKGAWDVLTRESAHSLLTKLLSFKGEPKDITEILATTMASNIMSLLIGRRMTPETEEKKIKGIVEFAACLENFGSAKAVSFIPGFRRFCQFFRLMGYDKAANLIASFLKTIEEEIKNHRTDDRYKEIQDFISLYDEKLKYMKTQNVPHYFSEYNLLGNITVLFLGGMDTLTASLSWLFRLMAKYPNVQRKVQNELDEVIGRDGVVSYEDRSKIPYTFAVLQEAQRYSSITPMTSLRRITSEFKVKGYTIPEGCIVAGNIWAMHNDVDVWQDPQNFRPERFMMKEKNTVTETSSNLVAFSVGRRSCPGETVAWMVLVIFFTTIMQKFTISAPPSVKLHFDVSSGIVEHLKPQPLCFSERN